MTEILKLSGPVTLCQNELSDITVGSFHFFQNDSVLFRIFCIPSKQIRVVKWAQNPIVLFAKLRSPFQNQIVLFAKLRKSQFHKLRKLRKLRNRNCDFCENCEFLFSQTFCLNKSAGIRTKSPSARRVAI